MLNSGGSLNRGNTTSSNMPPLPECLPLEPIMLSNKKYPRPGELRRVLGVPSSSEDRSFGVTHPKARAPVGNELKHIKETVEDVSKEARDRAKMFHESMFKLDKYRELRDTFTSKKRQRSDTLPGAQLLKAGIKIQQNTPDIMTQRLENRVKNGALNKRSRTSVADQQTDNRPVTFSRQQMFPDKDGNTVSVIGGIPGRGEEKTCRLLAGGEGLDQKIKKKRSVGAVGGRVINGERDVKRSTPPKMATDSKLRSCDSQSFRLKSSAGVGGINKFDDSFEPTISDSSPVSKTERESGSLPRDRVAVLEQSISVKGSNEPSIQGSNNSVVSSHTVIKGKVSKAQRTGSVMALDSSPSVRPLSGAFQGCEQTTVVNKVEGAGMAGNQKRQTSAGSAIHPMTQWGGQRPHKNSRTRRTNLVSPVSNNTESQISSQGFGTSEFGARTSLFGTAGLILPSSVDNDSPKVKSETENFSSLYGLSESEESGAGENKLKERRIDCGEAALTTPQKVGAFVLPMKKNNKLPTNESGDGFKRQGRIARGTSVPPGVPPIKEKSTKVLATELPQDIAPVSDKNKRHGKTGRPPSKKLKDRKGTPRLRPTLSNGSSDFTGESDDDYEELCLAAKSARNASSNACSSVFWKKMDYIFASVRSEDASYLNQQLSVAEELGDSLSLMFADELQVLGLDEGFSCSGKIQAKDTLCEKLDRPMFDKVTPLYQRVLSALIEEDESEEFYHHSDGKNMSLQSVSDDSHCGSCNQFDIEPKDRDRVESEVESNLGFQTQRNCLPDRLSCDGSSITNTIRNPSMSSSLHSNERWQGHDEFLHSEVSHAGEISSNHCRQSQTREFDVPRFPTSDCQYQLMSINGKVLLELHSIGLFPEALPDLADGRDIISGDIIELKEELHEQVVRKKKQLGKIDKAIQKGRDLERRNIEQVAMDKLVEMAYRKRMACRGSNASKTVVRKVSKQVAMAFIKRTVARCRKFEETSKSCFVDPPLQDVLFSVPPSSNDSKSVNFIGSGTASNTCNDASYQAGAFSPSDNVDRGSDRASYKNGPALNRGKKREALIDDVVGSASSRVTTAFNGTVAEVKGKRSDRDSLRNNSPSGGGGRSSLDSSQTEQKTRVKSKQKITQSTSGGGFHGGSSQSAINADNRRSESSLPGSPPKEAEKPIIDSGHNFQLNELDSIEDFGGNQDLTSLLNFEEDELMDYDFHGLEIPTDDLADLNMLM